MSDFAYKYLNSELDKLDITSLECIFEEQIAAAHASMRSMWETVKNDTW